MTVTLVSPSGCRTEWTWDGAVTARWAYGTQQLESRRLSWEIMIRHAPNPHAMPPGTGRPLAQAVRDAGFEVLPPRMTTEQATDLMERVRRA